MTLLRLREVYANASDRDSLIGDDSDNREPQPYRQQGLFEMSEAGAKRGWQMTEPTCPFGYEYLPSATFRDINFGPDGLGGASVRVAGEEAPRKGFQVCAHCGKVRMRRSKGESQHTRQCKMHDQDEETQLKPDNLHAALYLFRELRSEAMRVLLPMADVNISATRQQSFVAAFHMGLRRHFNGNVDHLQSMLVTEPIAGSPLRRQYLVLFDNVPGGTGYIKELADNRATVIAVLQGALAHLQNCGCQHNPRTPDGCYRCIFAYRDRFSRDTTSRRAAIEALSLILTHADTLAPIAGGKSLSHTDVNPLFDSELERRFIDALSAAPGCSIQPERINKRHGYSLTVTPLPGSTGPDGKARKPLRWSIELQVNLGNADGVAEASRPDFIIRPRALDDARVKPIAVFTDGLEHHKAIQADDTRKRASLMRSGQFAVWTLVWDDLSREARTDAEVGWNWLKRPADANTLEGYQLYEQSAEALGLPSFANQPPIVSGQPFEQLVAYLRKPETTAAAFAHFAISRVFSLSRDVNQDDCRPRAGTWLPMPWQDAHFPDARLAGERVLNTDPPVTLATTVSTTAMQRLGSMAKDTTPDALSRLPISACLNLDDREPLAESFKPAWRQFWAAANLLQFAPRFLPVSRSGIESLSYADLITYHGFPALDETDRPSTESLPEEWKNAIAWTEHAEALRVLAEASLPAPDIGADVTLDGAIVANLEWQWPHEHIGLLIDADISNFNTLTEAGWRLVTGVSETDLDTLAGWLATGKTP